MAKTLFDKIWDSHVVSDLGNGFVLLHIDRILLHDLSGARALRESLDNDGFAARVADWALNRDYLMKIVPLVKELSRE